MEGIRSPIISVLGHVDHGKTTLLDKIRGTAVAKSEPGLITQYISSSYVPLEVIKKMAGELFQRFGIKLEIPGLLWIDIPGHAAFTTLRKRGGAIADIAVLVVDIIEGLMPQTDESIMFLKKFKTPFVVALTKIDKIPGWVSNEGMPFFKSIERQRESVQGEVEKRLYQIVGQLTMRGFEAERYDRVTDFTKQLAIVPVSGITGEGVADLLAILCGLAQRFLKERLKVGKEGKGVVLELNQIRGLGITADIILYDGMMKRGDLMVIGGKKPVQTRIKSILVPAPLRELKMAGQFKQMDAVSAAVGVRVAAPGLEDVLAGSPVRIVKSEKDVEKITKELQAEIEEVEIRTEKEGVLIKTDTLGSLEALIKCISELGLPIRRAEVGAVTKSDLLELKPLKEKICFVFGLKVPDEIYRFAEDIGVKIFSSDVIYKLIEEYDVWRLKAKERAEEDILKRMPRPAKIRVLPGYVFRQSRPAIFGVEIITGTLKTGACLVKGKNVLGEVKEIQSEGKGLSEAKIGEKVAISMPDVVFGKDVREGDMLEVLIKPEELECLRGLKHRLREDEIELICGSG